MSTGGLIAAVVVESLIIAGAIGFWIYKRGMRNAPRKAPARANYPPQQYAPNPYGPVPPPPPPPGGYNDGRQGFLDPESGEMVYFANANNAGGGGKTAAAAAPPPYDPLSAFATFK